MLPAKIEANHKTARTPVYPNEGRRSWRRRLAATKDWLYHNATGKVCGEACG